jgi:uncharacterized protein YdaU (DUF1376 family)
MTQPKKGKPPAFPFYVKDWLSSPKINLMTPAQEGAYIRLLCYAWEDQDCSLPDDDEALAQLSRLGEGWLKSSANPLRHCFTVHPQLPGRLVNLRLLSARKQDDEWRAKCSQGGMKSAIARAKGKGTSRLLEGALELNGNSSSSSPSSSSFAIKKEEEGLTPLPPPLPDGFTVEEVLAAWNQIPGAKPVAAKNLSPGRGIHKRITVLIAQRKDEAREWWAAVFEAIKAQQFFLFSGENPKQWTAHLDWVLGPENLAKVLERRYEDFKPPQPPSNGPMVRPCGSRPREVVL